MLSALALGAWMQTPEPSGELFGLVTGPAGAPLATVRVSLAGAALSEPRTAITDAAGAYHFTRLPPGTYTLGFAAETYFPQTRQGVVIGAGARVGVNATLASTGPGPASSRATPAAAGEVMVRLETALGAIDLALDTVHAPLTTTNFLRYVDAGFYKGGRFYRITREDNYTPSLPNRPLLEMIQGGIDPARRPDLFPPIPLERTSVTGLKHVVGTISMARGNDADTATSEFFILLNDQPSLDFGGHRFDDGQGGAAFGRVTAGLDVVRKIQQQPVQGDQLRPPVAIVSAARLK